MEEEWRTVVLEGKETIYEVSNKGRIRHIYTKYIKTVSESKDGYLYTQLHFNNRIIRIGVHRLVAAAFLEKPPGKNQVNHINCDKLDNTVENLEWCNNTENVRHAAKNGLLKKFEPFHQPNQKYTEEEITKAIRLLMKGLNPLAVSRLTGIKSSTIYLISRGKRYQDLANKLGYHVQYKVPIELVPYFDLITKYIFDGLHNFEIIDLLPFKGRKEWLHAQIRSIRKALEGSTTIQIAT